MPLVFAANESSQREQYYADVLDSEYEFPKMYRKIVVEGEAFIYYRGTKGTERPGYFGVGVVGPVRDSAKAGRLVCDVMDVTFFDDAVGLRDPANGDYLEDVGTNRINMQRGVRPISEARATRILRLADTDPPVAAKPPPRLFPLEASVYAASKEIRDAIFRYSTDLVLQLLAEQSPYASITEMPNNNPGFDILVEGGSHRYVAVKGTMNPEVTFVMSEGERAYAEAHAAEFALIVVYNIDLTATTHRIARIFGAIEASTYELAPIQYRVRRSNPFEP